MAISYAFWVPFVCLYMWIMRGRIALGKYLLSTAGNIASKATNVFGAVFVSESQRTLRGFDMLNGYRLARSIHVGHS
jgi:hypothetical protein